MRTNKHINTNSSPINGSFSLIKNSTKVLVTQFSSLEPCICSGFESCLRAITASWHWPNTKCGRYFWYIRRAKFAAHRSRTNFPISVDFIFLIFGPCFLSMRKFVKYRRYCNALLRGFNKMSTHPIS